MKKSLAIPALVLFSVSAFAQTLPAGTALKVKLENALSTASSKKGDAFSGRITEPVTIGDQTIVPIGATVQGHVTKVNEPRRITGKPTIGILPEALIMPNGDRFALAATLVDTNRRQGTDVNDEGQFKGPGHDGQDLAEIGAGTGGGMLVGGLAGGGKGLLIGGAIGATATVAHWLGQHHSAMLPAGTVLTIELDRAVALTATTANASQ